LLGLVVRHWCGVNASRLCVKNAAIANWGSTIADP
jgi:hypothetical protein